MLTWLSRRTPTQGVLIGASLLLVIGILDTRLSYEFDLATFYIVPILLLAWVNGRAAGWAATIISSAIQTVTDIGHARPVSHIGVHIWSFASHMIIFGLLVELALQLRSALVAERALARRDLLTGLANRRGWYELAERALARAQRGGERLTILSIDCDGFKAINDTYGHHGGDQVLRAVGDGLRCAVRRSDIAARIGGDEFVLLLALGPNDTVPPLVERVAAALNASMRRGGWQVTFSIGAVTFSAPPETVDALMRRADALMYTVKAGGKDGVAYGDDLSARLPVEHIL